MIGISLVLLAVVVGLIALRNANRPLQLQEEGGVPSESGAELPDLTFKDVEENEIALRSLVGAPLVVNSWAVWCPFCKKEVPDFAAAQKEFGDKVKIIAVDRAEPLETVKTYTDELGVTDDLVFLLDPSDSFYRTIGGFAMPETIFVDARGAIVEHKRGPMELEEMREKIRRLIEL